MLVVRVSKWSLFFSGAGNYNIYSWSKDRATAGKSIRMGPIILWSIRFTTEEIYNAIARR